MTYLGHTVLDVRVFLCRQFPSLLFACLPVEYLREHVTSKSGRSCDVIEYNLQRLNDRYNDLGIIGTPVCSLLAVEEKCPSASLEIIVVILQTCSISKIKAVAEILG